MDQADTYPSYNWNSAYDALATWSVSPLDLSMRGHLVNRDGRKEFPVGSQATLDQIEKHEKC